MNKIVFEILGTKVVMNCIILLYLVMTIYYLFDTFK